MGSFISAEVRCPFYRRDDSKTGCLTCEGALPGSTVKSHFSTKEELIGQIRRYCAADYTRCPWFRVVMIQYQDG